MISFVRNLDKTAASGIHYETLTERIVCRVVNVCPTHRDLWPARWSLADLCEKTAIHMRDIVYRISMWDIHQEESVKNSGVERKRVPFAFIVVGSMFSVIAIVLLAVAIWTLKHQIKASTPLMALVAFGWAFLAMVVSMMLAQPGARQRAGRTHTRAGNVTIADPSLLPGQIRSTLTGPGVEATGARRSLQEAACRRSGWVSHR